MRLLITFLVSCLASSSIPLVGAAHHPRGGARRASHTTGISPASSSILAQRQYHPRRDLIDLCISLDATVLAAVLDLVDPLHADAHLCLCLQDLDIFLDTDVDALLITKILGRERLAAILKLLLNTSPRAQQCRFPPHSRRACVVGKPCGFTCDPGYVKVGDTCVCPRPNSECNGHCGSFPNGCPSSRPPYPRARKSTIGRISTLAQAQAICGTDKTVCGVPGREHTSDFECVDTSSSRGSCGGCVVPEPFTDIQRLAVRGNDCSSIPNAIASCSNSRCVVNQCTGGLTPNRDRSECTNQPAELQGQNLKMRKRRRNQIPDTLGELAVLPPPTIGPENAIVVSLDHTLGGIALADIDIVGLGSGINKPINGLLNDLGVGSADIKSRNDDIPKMPVDAHLKDGITALVKLTLVLGGNSALLPDPAHNDPHLPGKPDYTLPVDKNLVNVILQAVLNLLNSTHVSSLIDNINALVEINALVTDTLHGCGCIGNMGLENLVRGLDSLLTATLGLQNWCSNHPVVPLPTPTSSPKIPSPSGTPNPIPPSLPPPNHGSILSLAIDLGLDDLVSDLLTLLEPGEGSGNDGLQDILNTLVDITLKLKLNSPSSPSAPSNPPATHPHPHPPPNHPPDLTFDYGLVNALVMAIGNILRSLDNAELLANVGVALDVTGILGDTLSGCECVTGLHLEELVKNVDDILNTLLTLKRRCEAHPPTGPPSMPGSKPPLIINAEQLLQSLGLDKILGVGGSVNGLGKLAPPLNSLLNSLGLGGVRRWY